MIIQVKVKEVLVDEKGGPGSGNFNHKGIPGQRGGSAPGGGGSARSGVEMLHPSAGGKKRVSKAEAMAKLREEVTARGEERFEVDDKGRMISAPKGWELRGGDAVKTVSSKDGDVDITLTSFTGTGGAGKFYRAFVSGKGDSYQKWNVPKVRREGIYFSTHPKDVDNLVSAIETGGLRGYRKFLREH